MIFKGLVLCFCSFLFFINADGDESHIDEFNAQHLIEVLNSEDPYFGDTFDVRQAYKGKWVHSKTKKEGVDDNIGKYDGDWSLDVPAKHGIEGDLGLTFKEKAKHRATTAKLKRKFSFKSSPLILQYEVSFQDGQECGGGYIKLYSEEKNLDLEKIHDKSSYTIMFGPDKCGSVSKIHFIFRHKNPKTGVFEEKHGKQPSNRFEEIFTDSKPHLFTLIVYPNNLYKILVDQSIAVEGSLLEDFTPPVNPPAEIDDPADKKPEDWDDREKISDPSAVKPDDWDESEPRTIPDMNAVKPENWLDNEPTDIVDPSAEKPDDWDEEMDGEWEAPLVPNPACEDAAGCGAWTPPEIPNPKYKGKYTPPLIPNPAYKGKWEPRRIPNPDFFEDKNPFMSLVPVSAVGFELWSMSANLFFDNILITDDENFAKNWADMTYAAKIKRINKGSASLGGRLMKALNNRPGWWIMWIVTSVIVPIVGYGWYLWWRVKTEASLFSEVVEFTNKYPWLWAVYTLVMLLPVTLFVYFCFWSKQDTRDFLPCGPRIDEDDESPEAQHLMDKKDDAELDEEQNEVKSPEIKKKTSKSRDGRGSSLDYDIIDCNASFEDEGSADENEPITTGDENSVEEEEKPELKKRKSRKHDD